MTDLRSCLCHGPNCTAKITDEAPSDDFCSQACQARWQAAYVGAQADGGLLRESVGMAADEDITMPRSARPTRTVRINVHRPDPLPILDASALTTAPSGIVTTAIPSLPSRLWRWVWFRG
jgi:hypothetical protein